MFLFIYGLLRGQNVVGNGLGLIVASYVLYFTNLIESKYKKNGSLTKNEKISVWITVFLQPLLAQAFYYYCWKKEFPIRAAQANKYGWIAFLFWLVAGFGMFWWMINNMSSVGI